jgi:hypothetical protein
MPAQARLPGATSSEIEFELERFELAADRIEIAGRWYGLRGRRFVRPVLNLATSAGRRRAVALLEHKPWAADDGETWIAAFTLPAKAGEIEAAELEVGPGLVVELPAPGAVAPGGGRVNALRPVPREPEPLATHDRGQERDEAASAAAAVRERHGLLPAAPRRDLIVSAQAERDEAAAARDEAERERVLALNERDDALSRRDAALRDVDRAGSERDEAVAERDRVRAELERVTHERDHAYAERNRMMQDAERIAQERDQAAAERDAARNELSRALPARDEAIRERDAEAVRAERAEAERDQAVTERKSAVAQRDRARRERDRAMRAAGVEPPPFDADPAAPLPHRTPRPAPAAEGAAPASVAAGAEAAEPDAAPDSPPAGSAIPPGTALPSRPLKRIGGPAAGPAAGPASEAKPLLTPVDGSRPRRLSRTRPAPSGAARWTVRIMMVVLLLALAVALGLLLISLV